MAHVLVVDDDGHIREVVRFALEKAGHRVTEAADGRAALAAFSPDIDLVVLDVILPELDGLEVCRRLRARGPVPIIMLSSRDEELDRVLGLELGADDYVTKPFSPRELAARVKAHLRRMEALREASNDAAANPLTFGELRVDRARHRCYWGDAEIELTATEHALLATLCSLPGKVYARGELVDRVWGLGHAITERTIDSHVRRIRKKFGAVGADPVETVYGVGYRLAGS